KYCLNGCPLLCDYFKLNFTVVQKTQRFAFMALEIAQQTTYLNSMHRFYDPLWQIGGNSTSHFYERSK
ncbi:hypothetical protein, partial [Leptospira interrogans]|uniref:hypothetical protein n=1 Tax=Leptospira interrogans TaxID=173 RepID=UPI001E48268C